MIYTYDRPLWDISLLSSLPLTFRWLWYILILYDICVLVCDVIHSAVDCVTIFIILIQWSYWYQDGMTALHCAAAKGQIGERRVGKEWQRRRRIWGARTEGHTDTDRHTDTQTDRQYLSLLFNNHVDIRMVWQLYIGLLIKVIWKL